MGMMAAVAMGISAGSAVAGGINAKRAADVESRQLEIAAGQAQAASHRVAQDEGRKSRLIQSRALALAAASGGGASDPTVVDIIADIAGEGEYRSELALYEGKDRARAFKLKGAAALEEGRQRRTAGYIKGASTLMSAGSSMYEKYGRGGTVGGLGYGSADPTQAGDDLPY